MEKGASYRTESDRAWHALQIFTDRWLLSFLLLNWYCFFIKSPAGSDRLKWLRLASHLFVNDEG